VLNELLNYRPSAVGNRRSLAFGDPSAKRLELASSPPWKVPLVSGTFYLKGESEQVCDGI